MASLWQSDSKILCKTADAIGYHEHLAVTIERVSGTRRGMITYDSPAVAWPEISSHIATNVHTLLGAPLSITGENFGASADYTPRAAGATAAMSSEWISNTAIYCRTSPGISASQRVTLTLEAILKGSASEVLSYDTATVRPAGNSVRHAVASLSITASHMGVMDSSIKARLGNSSPERSLWVSGTSVNAMLAFGSARSRRAVLTAGLVAGSGSDFLSYDAPNVLYAHDEIDEGIRIAGIPFSQSGIGKNITMTCMTPRGAGSQIRWQTLLM